MPKSDQQERKPGWVERISANAPSTGTVQVALTMGGALVFGAVAVFVSLWEYGTIWRGLLWAGAWSSVGWFLGFLFGIPRYLSTDTARTPQVPSLEAAKRDAAAADATATSLREKAGAAAAADTLASQALKDATAASADAARRFDSAAADDPQKGALKLDADAKAKAADDARAAAEAASTAATEAEPAAAQAEAAAQAAKAKVSALSETTRSSPGSSLTVNTNLEQISDWLTKIIVGVSLVESQALLDKMQKAATLMAASIGRADEMSAMAALAAAGRASDPAGAQVAAEIAAAAASGASSVVLGTARSFAAFNSAESMAYAIMLYFFATGLLGSYLLTRLFLQRVLDNAAQPNGPPESP